MTTEHNPLREEIAVRLYDLVSPAIGRTDESYAVAPEVRKEFYRRHADAILELIVGGLDLNSCIVIPVNSDPLAVASLLEQSLPVESWRRLVLAILDMRMRKP